MEANSRASSCSLHVTQVLCMHGTCRWTIDALAIKFRIRKQRVMAILALKVTCCTLTTTLSSGSRNSAGFT